MFGRINSWDQVGQIAQGHFNEITKRENELHDSRMEICKDCPLFTQTSLGGMCDAKKCLNQSTGEIGSYPGQNIICGCGCRLDAKTRLKYAHCVLNKW